MRRDRQVSLEPSPMLTSDEAISVNGASAMLGNSAALAPTTARPQPYQLTRREWFVAAVVGCWLGALGVMCLLAVAWAWAIADRATSATDSVHWIGPDFTATAATSALVLAAVGGVAGSFVHAGSLFAARVGRRTFEVSYFWWYLLRPIESALVAMVFLAAIRSGLTALGTNTTGDGASVLAFLAGALAGLFTDRVMQRLRGILGATKTDRKASEQPAPGTWATPQQPIATG
jgi:hypothetical protein